MANRNYHAINFALEKNVVQIHARIVFDQTGSNSSAVLDTNNSKGVCAVHNESISFTGAVTNSQTSVGTISSFAGLFAGMFVSGSTGALQSNTKILNPDPNLTLNLDKQVIQTGGVTNLVASGGRLRIQFGSQEAVRLDAYNKLLNIRMVWDETSGSASGSATQVQVGPVGTLAVVVDNKVSQRTVGSVSATAGSTDCSLALQLGYTVSSGVGTAQTEYFRAHVPTAGEVLRLTMLFANSTGP